MAWDGAREGVPTGFGSLGAVAEDLERDGQFFLFDDSGSKVALYNVIVIAGTVGLHLFKEFNLKRSGFIDTGQHWQGLFDP